MHEQWLLLSLQLAPLQTSQGMLERRPERVEKRGLLKVEDSRVLQALLRL